MRRRGCVTTQWRRYGRPEEEPQAGIRKPGGQIGEHDSHRSVSTPRETHRTQPRRNTQRQPILDQRRLEDPGNQGARHHGSLQGRHGQQPRRGPDRGDLPGSHLPGNPGHSVGLPECEGCRHSRAQKDGKAHQGQLRKPGSGIHVVLQRVFPRLHL